MQRLLLIPECTISISTIEDGSILSYEDIIAKKLSSSDKTLYMPEHRHGTDVVFLTKENVETPPVAGDIVVTNLPKTVLIHQFADCVPFLCIDRKNKAVVFSHLGWKGLTVGGVHVSILALQAYLGSSLADIWVWIGPCIQKNSYIFDDEPIQNSLPTWQGCVEHHQEGEKSGWSIDLPGFIIKECARIGIDPAQIINDGRDTYSLPETFFSHKRAIEKNEERGAFIVTVSL